MNNQPITKGRLHELFEYRDGNLIWKSNPKRGPKRKGCIVGTKGNRCIHTIFDRKRYLVHRLIFLFHHGYLPNCIDHIDGNSFNNKIENLREATLTQNQYNSKTPSHSKSGIKGVRQRYSGKYYVCIKVHGKERYFGTFDDIELATLVATEVRNKYHGEFASHG